MTAHETTSPTGAKAGRHDARTALGFRLIGGMKLAGGLLLAAAGFGIFRMMHRDLGTSLEGLITRLHLDPDNRLVHDAVTRVGGLNPAKMKALGLGTFFYAALETTEGLGLLFLQRWAEYLTVVATASLLPLELYEIAQRVNAVRVGVLVINIAVLVYLVVKIRRPRLSPEN